MIRCCRTDRQRETAFFRAVIGPSLLPCTWRGRGSPALQDALRPFLRTPWAPPRWCWLLCRSCCRLADATALPSAPRSRSWLPRSAKEKVRWRRWTATVVGFAGVLVMVRPGEGSLQLGALIALANAATVAISILLVKRLSDSETPLMILTQFAIFSTLLLLVPAIWVWRWPAMAGGRLDRLPCDPRVSISGSRPQGGRDVGGGAVRYLACRSRCSCWLVWGEMRVWTLCRAPCHRSALYIAHREHQLGRERRRAAAAKPAPKPGEPPVP